MPAPPPDSGTPATPLTDPLPIRRHEALPSQLTIRPPGSKSETNRQYIIAALSGGTTTLHQPLCSDDCDRLLHALEQLGTSVIRNRHDVTIEGAQRRFPGGAEVNLGDGGTPSRFMIAAATLADQPVVVDGSARMRERPVAEGVELLRELGAEIAFVNDDEHLPIRTTPTDAIRRGGTLAIQPTQSSQFISALMLIAPSFDAPLTLQFDGPVTSRSYIDLTTHVLRQWNVEVEENRESITIHPASSTSPSAIHIEPDASSAVYWWSAAILLRDCAVTVPGLTRDSVQADVRYLDFLESLGARVAESPRGITVSLPYRDDHPTFDSEPRVFDMELMPDAALAAAAVLAMQPFRSTLTGLHTLRVKETDRVAALAIELAKLGCTIKATNDTLTIDPSTMSNEPVTIATYNDHRMAMAFGILGLARPGISIADPSCVAKSYPGFWSDFAALGLI